MSQVVTSAPLAVPAVVSSDQKPQVTEVQATTNSCQTSASVDTVTVQPVEPKRPQRPEVCLTDSEKAQLNWKQIGVLENLASGLSITDTARLVQVSRETIYRWLNENPIIRAAYNRWKLLCEQSAEARLIAFRETAIDVIAEQIVTKRDGRLALALLKSLQVLKPPQPGPTSPGLAKQHTDAQRIERHVESAERMEKAQRGVWGAEKYLVKEEMTGESEAE